MGDQSFVPGLIILAVGLAIALVVTLRMLRSARSDRRSRRSEDARLRIEDLERRRDEIYERLREAEIDDVDDDERRRLERSAAFVLRQLDQETGGKPRTLETTTSAPPPNAQKVPRQNAGLVGFAFGAGLVALIGILFVWVSRDATPAPAEQIAPSTPTSTDTSSMPPQIAARVRTLEERVAADSRDLAARKELAEIFIQLDLLMEAYQQSEGILEVDPNDPDGLYTEGLVRFAMGQTLVARQLLDRAIDEASGHIGARLVRGIIHMQNDDREAAIADWEAGLEASGGTHPSLTSLIAMARQGMTAEEIFGAAPAAEEAVADAGPGFKLSIDVEPGQDLPPGAVLFVSLRGTDPGPPAAVKRIDSPRFPLDLTLDQRDSMLGRPLPEEGVLSVRLDGDGSASTRSEGDLSAESAARIGEPVVLTLAEDSAAEGQDQAP